MPIYIKQEAERPIIKHAPSGQPVSLMKVTQTNVSGCFGFARARIATKEIKNRASDRKPLAVSMSVKA